MIVKTFSIWEQVSLLDEINKIVDEYEKKLYFVDIKGTTDVAVTTTNMVKLNQRIEEVNDAIDWEEVANLGLEVEYKQVIVAEDGSGYVFRFIDDNKVYNIEPQILMPGIQFSCEQFIELPIEKLKSLVIESRDDLVKQIEGQLTGNEKLYTVSSIDKSDTWFPKVYKFEYRIVRGDHEKVMFALVAWVAVINENFENVLKSNLNVGTCFSDVLKTYFVPTLGTKIFVPTFGTKIGEE